MLNNDRGGVCCRNLLLVVGVMVVVLQSTIAEAAKWSVTPTFRLIETYIDNVTLDSGSAAESSWVTQMNPGVSLFGNGKDLNLSLLYRLQNLVYANDSARNNSYQQLQSVVSATILPQYAFVDASTSISQQVLSPDDKVSTGNIGVVGNRSDVQTTRISPYLRTRFGRLLYSELRYTYDSVSYSKSSVLDSTSDGISVYLRPFRDIGSWSWQLNWQQSDISYRNRADEKREKASLNIGYQAGFRFGFNGIAGYESNRYSSNRTRPRGEHWSLGANWRPSQRTTLVADYGERYFGRTWGLKFSHQLRRGNWGLNYSESLSSRRLLQLELREIPEFDSGGNPVLDPLTGEQLLINEGFLVSFDEVFIQKRATVNWSIRTRKTNSNISVFIERRAFESNDFEDRVKGSSLRWSWNINRKNLFSANMSLRKTQRVASDDTYRTILTSFRRSLAPNATASISLSRLQRLGAAVNNTYTVNTISATFNMNW